MIDFEVGKDGSRFIGADKFGFICEDEFILNKDLENDSFTQNEMVKMIISMKKMLKKSPDEKFFGLLLYAGHGMIRDGV